MKAATCTEALWLQKSIQTTDLLEFNSRRQHKMLGVTKVITNLTLHLLTHLLMGNTVYLFCLQIVLTARLLWRIQFFHKEEYLDI